jgi:hypothetical protein
LSVVRFGYMCSTAGEAADPFGPQASRSAGTTTLDRDTIRT